ENRLQSQVHGSQSGVLAAGTLSVIVPSHHETAPRFFSAFGESGIDDVENELRNGGNVGTKRQDFGTRGHDMVGGDVVAHLEEHLSLHFFAQGFLNRKRFDIGAA